MTPEQIDALAWDKQGGLLPAIVQDAGDGRVLMLGYMNREALAATLAVGRVTFYSRSRGRLWTKGESSGHKLALRGIEADCDGDTLLIQVEQVGAACHEGYQSCFFRSIEGKSESFKVTEPQLETPEQIYGKK